MAILSVKATNFKKHKNLDIKIEGKSFLLLGDSEEGKSSILDIILSSLMMKPYPVDALTDGEEAGATEVVTEFEGIQYTIKRKYDRKGGLKRFTVTDEHGATHSLTNLLERLFGVAFKNSYFDYEEYFYRNTTPEARFEYMMTAIGGEEVMTNTKLIKKLVEERGKVGTKREAYDQIIDNSTILNRDTLAPDIQHYSQPDREVTKEASRIKDIYLKKNLIDKDQLEEQRQHLQTEVDNKKYLEESISAVDLEIAELEKQIAALREQKESFGQELADIDDKQFKAVSKELEKVNKDILEADEKNIQINLKANELYTDQVKVDMEFNHKKGQFLTAIESLKEFTALDKEWTSKDEEIKALRASNRTIFKNRLKVPDLTIGTNEKDEEIILYQNKEFSLGPISKGRSIKIASEIQRALNPKERNFIIISEAQSMGSLLKEVLEECKEFGVQTMVEVTEMDKKLEIQFTEN